MKKKVSRSVRSRNCYVRLESGTFWVPDIAQFNKRRNDHFHFRVRKGYVITKNKAGSEKADLIAQEMCVIIGTAERCYNKYLLMGLTQRNDCMVFYNYQIYSWWNKHLLSLNFFTWNTSVYVLGIYYIVKQWENRGKNRSIVNTILLNCQLPTYRIKNISRCIFESTRFWIRNYLAI